MVAPKSLFQQTVMISTEYLGPSAERFVSRQIVNHLRKDPEKLTARDLPELIKWLKITFSLLTDDQTLVDSFVTDLESLPRTTTKAKKVSDAQTK